MDPSLAVIIAAVLATIVLLLIRWFLHWRREASGDEREMISLVFLLRQPRNIDDNGVRQWAREAFKTTFDTDNPDTFPEEV